MYAHHIVIVALDDEPLVLAQNFLPGKCDGNPGDDGVAVRIHHRHDIRPQTDGRKQGDPHGNKLTSFHVVPASF